MTALAKPALEDLLRVKKFGNTLFSSVYDHKRLKSTMASTGIVAIDDALGGGLPRGHLSEIVGGRSTGRASALCAAFAAATARGDLVALVDTLDTFDAESGAAAGIDLSRLLWIRGRAGGGGDGMQRTVDRALKALGLLLQADAFGVVALDLANVPDRLLRRIPFTTWLRLPRVIEGRPTACVLVADRPIARSAGGMTVALEAGRSAVRWVGGADQSVLLRGFDLSVRAIGARQPYGGHRRGLFVTAAEAALLGLPGSSS